MAEYTTEDFKQAILSLFRSKLLILLITGIGFFGGMLYTVKNYAQHTYSADATISVVYGENLGQISGNTVISNYSGIATSKRVCDYAAILLDGEGLSGDQIKQMLEVSAEKNSSILKIRATNDSPRHAILVANAVAESFVTQMSVLTGSNTIQVIDAAVSAEIKDAKTGNHILLYCTAISFIVACVLIAISELISGTLRSVNQCIVSEGELLAVIPARKRHARQKASSGADGILTLFRKVG